MPPVVYAILSALGALFRSQRSLRVENIALRHQLAIYQRTVKRPRIRPEDRILWSWLSRHWAPLRIPDQDDRGFRSNVTDDSDRT